MLHQMHKLELQWQEYICLVGKFITRYFEFFTPRNGFLDVCLFNQVNLIISVLVFQDIDYLVKEFHLLLTYNNVTIIQFIHEKRRDIIINERNNVSVSSKRAKELIQITKIGPIVFLGSFIHYVSFAYNIFLKGHYIAGIGLYYVNLFIH